MKINNKLSIFIFFLFLFLTIFNASQTAAQAENGVTLYQIHYRPPASRPQKTYAPGIYRLDADPMNNNATSIKIPDGYEVWACDDSRGPTADGSNNCSSYFEGNYNFNETLFNKVSYLDVQYNKQVKTGDACLFAGFDTMGLGLCLSKVGLEQLAMHKFEHPANFDLPNVGDWRNKASSIWIKEGFTAEVCTTQKIFLGNDAGKNVCATYGAGEHNFSPNINNRTYYIKITRPLKERRAFAIAPDKFKFQFHVGSIKNISARRRFCP